MGCVFPLTTPCCDGVCFYTEPHFVFGHLINSYKPKSQLLTICAIFRISCHIQSILANEEAKYVLSKPDHFDGQPKRKSPQLCFVRFNVWTGYQNIAINNFTPEHSCQWSDMQIV